MLSLVLHIIYKALKNYNVLVRIKLSWQYYLSWKLYLYKLNFLEKAKHFIFFQGLMSQEIFVLSFCIYINKSLFHFCPSTFIKNKSKENSIYLIS